MPDDFKTRMKRSRTLQETERDKANKKYRPKGYGEKEGEEVDTTVSSEIPTGLAEAARKAREEREKRDAEAKEKTKKADALAAARALAARSR